MRYLILILALCLSASAQPIFGGGKVAATVGPRGTTLPASCSGDGPLFQLTATDGGNSAGLYNCVGGTYVYLGPGAGDGDVTGPAASVDGEAAVYDGITGKAIKRFAGTGLGLFTSGVLSVDSGLQFNGTTKSLGVFGPIVSGQTSNYHGKILLNGITSGTVTIQPQDAAGTFTLYVPSLSADATLLAVSGTGTGVVTLAEGTAPGAPSTAGDHNLYFDSADSKLKSHENGGSVVTYAATADPVFTGSVQIPNGTGPTVDAAGEAAVDTTTDQFQFYGAAKRALPSIQHISFVIPAPADTDDINLMKAPYGMTILGIDAIVQGSTSVTGQLQECTSSGASCTDLDSDIVADSDGAADDGSLTDSSIASGAWIRWKTTSVSGTPTFLTVTVRFRVVAD